ncbi:MAG: PucR family transcriptional regulator ligand-binding domain-containing protein [Nocardioidaceae bacterium]
MAVSLRRVLDHPSLQPAHPLVVAGESTLDQLVRWVHSSEVLDIAALLRGGELLLTGGTMLAESPTQVQRRYIRELAERGVTGVAIETPVELGQLPPAVVEEALAQNFALVELRKVVPFVEVAEAVNGELVNESVTNLRYSAELTHALSGLVAGGAGVQEVVQMLADRVQVSASLVDGLGKLLAEADPRGAPAVAEQPSGSEGGTITCRVTVRGVLAGTLALHSPTPTDMDRLELAATTAAESLSLAMLRSSPPAPRDLAASDLVRICAAGGAARSHVERLGAAIGFAVRDPVVGVVATSGQHAAGLSRLDTLLRHFGRTAIDTPSTTEMHALISIPEGASGPEVRRRLLVELGRWAEHRVDVVAVVGPAVPCLPAAPDTLGAAIEVARSRAMTSAARRGLVIDTHDQVIEALLRGGDARTTMAALARQELAMFDLLSDGRREILLETLGTYLDCGCNKSRTAAALHLTRQALYGRLDHAFALLGGDPTGTRRALGLQLALRARPYA